MSKWLSLSEDIGELFLSIHLSVVRNNDVRSLSSQIADFRPIARNIDTLCLFIGYPRSGHSLISSLIDAHPHALIAHRLDSLKFLQKGMSEESIYYLMYKNSLRFAKNGRSLTRYSYPVPNQWQGQFNTLYVIGDQDSKWTVRKLHEDATLLPILGRFNAQVKLIHVIRNPFDNISTMAQRSYSSIRFNIKRYFYLCACVQDVKQRVQYHEKVTIMDVKYEDFLLNPVACLRNINYFLGLSPIDEYLQDCAKIVYRSPHQTRYRKRWTSAQKETVIKKMANYPFLEGYSYDK